MDGLMDWTGIIGEVEKAIESLSRKHDLPAESLRRQYVLSTLFVGSPLSCEAEEVRKELGDMCARNTSCTNTPWLQSSPSEQTLYGGDAYTNNTPAILPTQFNPQSSYAKNASFVKDIEAVFNGQLSDSEEEDLPFDGPRRAFAKAYPPQQPLDPNKEYQVHISYVDGPIVYVRLLHDKTPSISDEFSRMQPLPPVSAVQGLPVLVLASLKNASVDRQRWRRGVIESNYGSTVDIRLVDYGILVRNVRAAKIRALPVDLISPPVTYKLSCDWHNMLVSLQDARNEMKRFRFLTIFITEMSDREKTRLNGVNWKITSCRRLPLDVIRKEADSPF